MPTIISVSYTTVSVDSLYLSWELHPDTKILDMMDEFAQKGSEPDSAFSIEGDMAGNVAEQCFTEACWRQEL